MGTFFLNVCKVRRFKREFQAKCTFEQRANGVKTGAPTRSFDFPRTPQNQCCEQQESLPPIAGPILNAGGGVLATAVLLGILIQNAAKRRFLQTF